MVKTLPSNAEGVRLIPGQGTNNSHATGYSQNSLKILKKREITQVGGTKTVQGIKERWELY